MLYAHHIILKIPLFYILLIRIFYSFTIRLFSFFFFFSSRRRHTRFDCDWSSDVCSSDLFDEVVAAAEETTKSGKLVDIQTFPVSKLLYTRFNYTTGDAAGQNLTGKEIGRASCRERV